MISTIKFFVGIDSDVKVIVKRSEERFFQLIEVNSVISMRRIHENLIKFNFKIKMNLQQCNSQKP